MYYKGGSGGNNLHDLVGNIQEMYPGLSIRLVRSQSVTPSPSRKKSEDDEVQMDAVVLQTHASECNGDVEQVKHFALLSNIRLCYRIV